MEPLSCLQFLYSNFVCLQTRHDNIKVLFRQLLHVLHPVLVRVFLFLLTLVFLVTLLHEICMSNVKVTMKSQCSERIPTLLGEITNTLTWNGCFYKRLCRFL